MHQQSETRPPVYRDEELWRMAMMMNLVALRRTVAALTLLLTAIGLAFAVADRWPDAPLGVTLGCLLVAIALWWSDDRAFRALSRLHDRSEYRSV